jgi:hypothetical protein
MKKPGDFSDYQPPEFQAKKIEPPFLRSISINGLGRGLAEITENISKTKAVI